MKIKPHEVVVHTCRLCNRDGVREWLDFGPQTIRNRFLHSPSEFEYACPLILGVCRHCGTVQLASPPPVQELRPRFGWITYNEPERHLDNMVTRLTTLPGITPRSTFAGLTYKDDSTLARLNRLDYLATWRPELEADLGIASPFAGIESVQERLTPALAGSLVAKFGRPDVLLVRHVLEHAQDTHAAMGWAHQIVRPGGYVVFEVPDVSRALDRLDYTTIWEEHILYFTTSTLRRCLASTGFEVVALESYHYPLENSLIVIASPVSRKVSDCDRANPVELAQADRFVREFPRVRNRVRQRLQQSGRVAMLGAGHLTGAFINLYGLADRIDFVADDNPNKQGLFMPGSRLPILPSTELMNRGIDLCLMSVRPEIEDAVVAKNAAFTDRGGMLASIFPDSPYAMDRLTQRTEVLA